MSRRLATLQLFYWPPFSFSSFSFTTINHKTHTSILFSSLSLSLAMPGGLNSSKLALIVIDMQNEFAPMAQAILTEVNATIASARRAGIPVIFSQHGHPNPEIDEKTSVLVRWWGASGSIRKGSHNWKLLSNLDVAPNEIILDEKTTYDAFYQTRLKSLLDEQNVDTVIIAGVLTQFCCETTARSAFVQNYDVIFLSDGTGPPCQSTLDIISYGFGTVITCAKMRAKFDTIHKDKSK